MNNLLFIISTASVVHSLKDTMNNSELIALMTLTFMSVPVIYLLKKKRNKTERKQLRKLKWKLRWQLLKALFRKEKLNESEVFAYLGALGLGVLLVIWWGWIWGILGFLGLLAIAFKIGKGREDKK